jgi:hypothetical protein
LKQIIDPSGHAPFAVTRRGFSFRRGTFPAFRRQQRAQPLRHRTTVLSGLGGQCAIGFEAVDPARHLIEGCQRLVDDGGADAERALPDRIQQVLRGMHQQAQGRKLDHARGTLERVEGAEHAVDSIRRGAIALQCDEVVRRLANEIAGFGNELFLQGVHGTAPVSTAAWRTSSASVTGFTR